MKKQVGIWIDTKQAIIVWLQNNEHFMKKLNSAVDGRVREPGEGKWFTRMGNQFFDFSFKKKAHRIKETIAFFKDVQNEILDAGEIVLFGPAAKKNELKKFLMENGMAAETISGVETADSMTDNQVAAWVKKYYSN